MNTKKIIANILLLITATVWGIAFVFQRTGMDEIGPFTFNAGRLAFAALSLFIVVKISDYFKKKSHGANEDVVKYDKNGTLKAGIMVGIALFFATTFQQSGIQYTTAGKASFITSLYIILVPILTFIIFKNKTNILTWISVAIGCVGLYLLSITSEFTIAWGDTLVLVSAVFFSCHIIICDRFVSKVDVLRMSMYQFLLCFVLSTVCAFIFESPTLSGVMTAMIPILYCGVISGGMGYTLQMLAQKDTDPTVASLIMSLESVVGALSGWMVLNEVMTPREIIGCAIMFAAIILIQIPIKGKRKEIEVISNS